MTQKRPHRSHFSQLLSSFHVSGTELADTLHIDSSLVSKWKNNKRSLKGNSTMLNSIVDYFLTLDVYSGYSTINALISNEQTVIDVQSKEAVSSALKHWLLTSVETSDESLSLHDFAVASKKGKESSHLEFYGNEGKRAALLGLLRTASAMPPGQELWCILQDNQRWFRNDEVFRVQWQECNLNFLTAGHTIHIILSIDRHYDLLAYSLISWLPLFLTGNVYPFFSPTHLSPDSYYKSVILLKDKLLLYQLSPLDEAFDGTTVATTNETILHEFSQLLQPAFEYATPLFTRYYPNDHNKYASFLSNMVNLNDDQYIFMRFPFINVISSVQIKEILTENMVSEDVIKQTIQTCKILKKDARKGSGKTFRYMLPKDQLEHLLTQKRITLDVLSFISGKKLSITNAQFRELLCKLIFLLTSESHKSIHEITLLEHEQSKQMNDLNLFVKRNTCISIFNVSTKPHIENSPELLTTTESPIIQSLYIYCDHIWNQTISQKRERPYVARQLEIMLKTIAPPEE